MRCTLLALVFASLAFSFEGDPLARRETTALRAAIDAASRRLETEEVVLTPRVREGWPITVVLRTTNKGNGELYVPGSFYLHVIDWHDDCVYFDGGVLDVWLRDVDGFLDLVVSATAIHTDDKTGAPIRCEPILGLYLFDRAAGTFTKRLELAPVPISSSD